MPEQGLRFGQDIYIEPNTAAQVLLSSFFTVEAWVRFDPNAPSSDNSEGIIFEKEDGGANLKLSVSISDNMLRANILGTDGAYVDQYIVWSASSNPWRYIAVTFERVYYNTVTGSG